MYLKFKDKHQELYYEDPSEEEIKEFFEKVLEIALFNIHKYVEIPEKSRKKVDKEMKKAKEETLKYLEGKKLENNELEPKFYVFIVNLENTKKVKKVPSNVSNPAEIASFYSFVADVSGKYLGLKPFWITREMLAKKYPELKIKGMGRYKRLGK